MDNSVSKVIDEDDVIRAIFEPDSEIDDPNVDEIEVEIPEYKEQHEENDSEELELTVQTKIKEEEDTNEIKNEELEDYDPTFGFVEF